VSLVGCTAVSFETTPSHASRASTALEHVAGKMMSEPSQPCPTARQAECDRPYQLLRLNSVGCVSRDTSVN
jgi:hypothetical protein